MTDLLQNRIRPLKMNIGSENTSQFIGFQVCGSPIKVHGRTLLIGLSISLPPYNACETTLELESTPNDSQTTIFTHHGRP